LFDWTAQQRERGNRVIVIKTPNLDARLAAILRDPDRYYADATARAWTAATAEVDADLAERAQHRLNHHQTPSAHPQTWLPAATDPPQQH
jgi:hypothetical protein